MYIRETSYDADQKIWAGPRTERKYSPNTTLGEAILEVLKINPEKIMQISDSSGEVRTAAQLLRDSQFIAEYLISQGLRPGDIVGICANNTTNLTAVIIAALLCGTPYSAAFAGFDKENVVLSFKITTPNIVFCDVGNYATVKAAVNQLGLSSKIVTINGKIKGAESVVDILKDEGTMADNLRYPCADLNADATAAVHLSSGTTGSPKGITVSHARFLEHPAFFGILPNDIISSFGTMYWITASIILYASLLNGATRIITEIAFTTDSFCYLVEKYSINIFLMSTTYGAILSECDRAKIEKPLKSLKILLICGSKVHEFVAKKVQSFLNEHARLLIAYGFTENGAVATATASERLDCEGKLMPNFEARIIDQTTGKPLGPNEQGHLLLRSPYKWSGYYNDEIATKKAYSNDWINIEDIAYFDDEGHLFILGRVCDFFRSNDFFINPNDIEETIMQLPGAGEVCVFGEPDVILENLISCAVIRANNDDGRKLSENDVVEYVKNNLMDIYHINGGVYFVNSLPRNATGKILRRNVWNEIRDCIEK